VPPFSEREGGVVVNAAISLTVEAEVTLGGTAMLLHAEDLDQAMIARTPAELEGDGPLPLLRAALRMFPVGPCTLRTRSAVPPGSGLGSSGALDVVLVAALAQARGEELSPAQTADYGWELEALEARLPGGRQDQYAAALGGFHRFGFRDPDAAIRPLAILPDFAAELSRRIVLCYTGRSRVSGDTIARVMGAYGRGDLGVTRALHGLVETAERMTEALETSQLSQVATLLERNWRQQQALDPAMRTGEMAALESAMLSAGAIGGKAVGAGAGGCMFFLAGDGRRAVERAIAAAMSVGATPLPATWDAEGVRTW
jgi:D-glycero-alpha-D-manno-heptose-7-phosphate kinase